MKTTRVAAAIVALVAAPLMAQEMASMQRAPTPPSAPGVPGLPGQTTIIRPTGDTCLPASIARDRDIVILSAGRGGGGSVPFAIGETSDPATLVSVTGGSGRDVVLVLSGGSPVLWDIRGVARGRIKAVLAHGSSPQAVIGATDGIQTEFLDSRSRIAAAMGSSCSAIMRAGDLGDLRSTQKSILARFGVTPTRLYASSSPAALDIDGATVTAPDKVDVKPQDVKAAMPIDSNALMPGVWGMRQLVEQGYARPFTAEDVARWKTAGGRLSRQGGIDAGPQYEGMDPETRKRMIEIQERRMQAYGEPRTGFVLVRSVPALPRGYEPNPSTALVVPQGVDAPATTGRMTDMFRYRLDGVQMTDLTAMPSRTTQGYDSPMNDPRVVPPTPVELSALWQKDGVLVRFPTDASATGVTSGTAAAPVDSASPPTSSSGLGWALAALVAAALAGGAFLLVRRRPDLVARLRAAPTPRPAQPKARPESEDEVTMLLTRLEGLVPAGTLLDELSDFRHQVSRLAIREDLEEDLIAECEQIVDLRFVEVARRYVKARPSADGEAATNLDHALQATLVDMSGRLAEIHDMQNLRNVEALRGTAAPRPAQS